MRAHPRTNARTPNTGRVTTRDPNCINSRAPSADADGVRRGGQKAARRAPHATACYRARQRACAGDRPRTRKSGRVATPGPKHRERGSARACRRPTPMARIAEGKRRRAGRARMPANALDRWRPAPHGQAHKKQTASRGAIRTPQACVRARAVGRPTLSATPMSHRHDSLAATARHPTQRRRAPESQNTAVRPCGACGDEADTVGDPHQLPGACLYPRGMLISEGHTFIRRACLHPKGMLLSEGSHGLYRDGRHSYGQI